MTTNANLSIDGYEFHFVFGNIWAKDGIIIDPRYLVNNMHAGQYERALYKAAEAWEAFDAVCRVYEYGVLSAGNEHKRTDQQLIDDLILAEKARDQTWWDLEHYHSYPSAMIERIRKEQARRVLGEQKKETRRSGRTGFIYLIKADNGFYKIGRTSDPEDRIRTFAVKLPFEVEYVCVVNTPDMYALEAKLHLKFADRRVNGEWFELTPDDVDYIRGLVE